MRAALPDSSGGETGNWLGLLPDELTGQTEKWNDAKLTRRWDLYGHVEEINYALARLRNRLNLPGYMPAD